MPDPAAAPQSWPLAGDPLSASFPSSYRGMNSDEAEVGTGSPKGQEAVTSTRSLRNCEAKQENPRKIKPELTGFWF